MAKNSTTAARARALFREMQALELRRAGMSYREIAARIGIGKSRAHQLVSAGLEDAKHQVDASRDELLAEELFRLDGMLQKLYPKAVDGDLQAVDRVLKIGERRAKLLGLDAPIRTALHGGGDDAPPISTVSEAKVTFYVPDNGLACGTYPPPNRQPLTP